MRTFFFIITLFGLTAGLTLAATSVTKSNAWSNTYRIDVSEPRLRISNIWGGVKVRAGEEGQIVVSVEEVRSAANQRMFDRSLEMIKLNVEADASGVSLRVGDPEDRWNKNMRCDDCRVDYQFDVQVPAGAVIDVGTVMDGLVDVSGITGRVSASNVNGSVRVTDIHNCDEIESVNGQLEIAFSRSPNRDCKLETVNGDVTLSLPANASLDVTVDLFNGEVLTDFEVEPLTVPAKVEREAGDGRYRYSIKQNAGIRIGSDGPKYSIASINGDVRIKKDQ